MSGWLVWVCLAGAGELDEEVARAHLLAGDAVAARRLAAQAMADEPSALAVNTFLEASATLGLGDRAIAELAGIEPHADPVAVRAEALHQHLQQRDDKAAAGVGKALMSELPERPELLAALWGDGAGSQVVKLRRKVLATTAEEPLDALRLHHVHVAADHDDPATRALVASVAPVWERRRSDVERHEAARRVFEGADLPEADPDEQLDVAWRAHRMFLDAGRAADAVSLWAGLRPQVHGLVVEAGRARALVAAGRPAALDVADVLAAPAPHDRAMVRTDRMARDAAALWSARAHIDAAERAPLAWAGLVVASVLDAVPDEAALAKSIDTARRGHVAPEQQAALAAVGSAADADALRQAVEQALIALTAPVQQLADAERQSGVYRASLGELWRSAALRADALQLDGLVRGYGVLALAADPDWRDLARPMAEALDAADAHEAAFAWFARVRARADGEQVAAVEQHLQRLHDGPGDALAVATAMEGPPGSVADDAPAVVARRARPARPADAIGVGTQPVWSLDAPGGTIGSSELKGRVVVVSFWDSDCGACLDLLPELGSLTRRLRARGRDVVLVAVSADAEQAPFDDVYRLGQRWGELVRSPELAATWGVPRLPSTYVIDRSGVIVYQVNHRIRDDELEPVLLKAAM